MNKPSLGFTIVAKVTLGCNLRCQYCYCSDGQNHQMSRETLVAMLYAAAQLDATNIEIVWHGGEPLLAGLDFFADVVDIQDDVARRGGVTFTNSIQTNATLITAQHIAFFREHAFKVGISLDGYRGLNDRNRRTAHGNSVYDHVVEHYRRLRSGGVTPGMLAVLDLEDLPDIPRFVDWLIELDCQSIGFNLRYGQRMGLGDERYGDFLRALAQEVRARKWKVAIRELLPEVAAENIYDACHPGWACHKTIAAVDEKGNIYFGCDRFMAGSLHDSGDFVIGHVDQGFREAFASQAYAQLGERAACELATCRDRCGLFEQCQGGCIADWMLLAEDEQRGSRRATAYCAGQRAKREVIDGV